MNRKNLKWLIEAGLYILIGIFAISLLYYFNSNPPKKSLPAIPFFKPSQLEEVDLKPTKTPIVLQEEGERNEKLMREGLLKYSHRIVEYEGEISEVDNSSGYFPPDSDYEYVFTIKLHSTTYQDVNFLYSKQELQSTKFVMLSKGKEFLIDRKQLKKGDRIKIYQKMDNLKLNNNIVESKIVLF